MLIRGQYMKPAAIQLDQGQKMNSAKLNSLFRRPLPSPAIDLSTDEGVALFSKALSQGTARCFFPLIQQQSHQSSPAYCGLGTLATILNALGCDPHRQWKGVWRYYTEQLLDCCVPLDKVESSGIDFDSMACLARCNGLATKAKRGDEITLDEFRTRVKALTASTSTFIALSYSRKTLNQTGDGHWSPLGGYEATSDMALILDQARFKYNAHWVPLSSLYEAMNTIDPDTGKRRGFLELTPHDKTNGPPPAAHPLALRLHLPFKLVKERLNSLAQEMRLFYLEVSSCPKTSKEDVVSLVLCHLAQKLDALIDRNQGLPELSCCSRQESSSGQDCKKIKLSENPSLLELEQVTQQIVKEVLQTKTHQRLNLLGTNNKPNNNNDIWPTLMVLLLKREFWTEVIHPEDAHSPEDFFETIHPEKLPNLAKEIDKTQRQLELLM